MRIAIYVFGICMGAFGSSFAQEESINIVPNPGFEMYSGTPLGWFYTGRDFTRVVKYWESPTAASPDVYGPNVYVPSQWMEQGFGTTDPAGGKSMVGITVYGCEEGKPHCREYVQIQLVEPLVVGQRYAVEFKASPLPGSVRIRNIGTAFVMEPVRKRLDVLIDVTPQFESGRLITAKKGSWATVSGEFHASEPAEYLIIGNFFTDEKSDVKSASKLEALKFAYYYLDDVVVKKLPPIIEVAPVQDLSQVELIAGKKITLHNIYFDHDRDDFLPRSYGELNALTQIMRENPEMKIEVHGHTDLVGTTEYNMALSIARAKAVEEYLAAQGIEQARVSSKGYGSSQPLASNDSEEGRKENRRVEFLILSK